MKGTQLLGLGLLAAAGVFAYFGAKEAKMLGALRGFTPQGLGPDKDRAQRWLSKQLRYTENDDAPRREVMKAGWALESGKAQALSDAVHRMRGSIRYETVSPWGFGRPE